MTLTRDEALAVVDQLKAAASRATSDAEAKAVARELETWVRRLRARRWEPYPWQQPHVHPDGWVSERAPGKNVCDQRCPTLPPAVFATHEAWLQRGGRGTGKTEGASRFVNEHVEGPPCDPRVPGGHRLSIVAPTQPDAVSSCVAGVSGLQAINPQISSTKTSEGTIVRWPNGSVARVVGANSPDDINRLRAWTNICLAWVEEAAAMRYLGGLRGEDERAVPGVLDQLPFTLRLGSHPHMVITTTPQNRREVVVMLAKHHRVETWGRTEDADRLDPTVRASYESTYRGSTLGKQELDGDLIADVIGALWVQQRPDIIDGLPNPDDRPGVDNDRAELGSVGWNSHDPAAPITRAPVMLQRVIVAVDPPGGRTEAGIVVIGSVGQHAYVLADLSTAGGPDTWANLALDAYRDFGAEGIAAEHTYGGDMVRDAFATRDNTVPIHKVPTKVGKRLRAEPVQGVYQQHRVHHVGRLDGLETEMRTWVPDVTTDSPNRIDALVHGITYLLIRGGQAQAASPRGRQPAAPAAGRLPAGVRRRPPGLGGARR